jgi:hypothetical protein
MPGSLEARPFPGPNASVVQYEDRVRYQQVLGIKKEKFSWLLLDFTKDGWLARRLGPLRSLAVGETEKAAPLFFNTTAVWIFAGKGS